MLEFLLVYRESGLPLYSKCFSDFCKIAFKKPMLMTGFLTAIQSLSEGLTKGEKLEAIKMGKATMFFKKTFPSRHFVVIGLAKNNRTLAEDIFKAIQIVLEIEFEDVDWDYVSQVQDEFDHDFEEILLKNALIPAIHMHHLDFKDQCPSGDQCPIKSHPSDAEKGSIWSIIEKNYKNNN